MKKTEFKTFNLFTEIPSTINYVKIKNEHDYKDGDLVSVRFDQVLQTLS